ncbi:MAG TPA: hypothetical protein VMT16_12955 [Thermoanaerobaculia bacterium]|nr:hypothetical protein [Thermoanaerobaculia bacterium]
MPRLRLRPLLALAAGLALWAALHAFWIEPRLLLWRSDVALPLAGEPLRLVHLADLHIAEETPLLRRLLARVAAESPDYVVMSGDWVADAKDYRANAIHARAAARFAAQLRAIAPLLSVQGHSDYLGEVVAPLARAGVEWLSNEGRLLGPAASVTLLGVNQQVGQDALVPQVDVRFAPLPVDGEPAFGRRGASRRYNAWSSWDPSPRGLADSAGPLAWSGYDLHCRVWIDDADTMAGLASHSRFVAGEDRMVRLARGPGTAAGEGSYMLLVHGSSPTSGQTDTGFVPTPGRWHHLRLRTEVLADRLRVLGRAWDEGAGEPGEWQAWLEDASPLRVAAGTVSLWSFGPGLVAYRGCTVTDGARTLLSQPLDRDERPHGWRDGPRGTRLEMALARTPPAPAGTPVVVLSHVPAVAREAAARGIEAVLAGHTHGGQVRVPGFGALVTRSPLGRRYDRGLFRVAAGGGTTALYVNPGVGTSYLPVRFWNPPTYAVVRLGRAEVD